MMVVNYSFQIPEWDAKRWKDEPQVMLERGQALHLQGQVQALLGHRLLLRPWSAGVRGLQAPRPRDRSKSCPTGSTLRRPPWHPLEVARMEEENAKLAEKAKATATQQ